MLFEALIIGFIIGIIRDGRFSNISMIHFRGTVFLIFGLVLQVAPVFLGIFNAFTEYYPLMAFCGIISILITMVLNLSVKGFWIIMIGALLNILAMALNGFVMPTNLETMASIGAKPLMDSIADGSVINYMGREGAHGVAYWLGKWIPIPYPQPLGRMISFGDIVMSLGFVWFIQAEMNSKRYLTRMNHIVRQSYSRR